MKTLHIITLLLIKLCNQRRSCFQKKQEVTLSKMNGLIFMFMLFFSTHAFALSFDKDDLTHLNIIQPTGIESYDNLQFSIMVLNQSNTDDGMRNFNLYIVEKDNTETLIMNMNNKDCKHDGIALDAFTPVNSYKTGFINNTQNLVKLNSITNINFSWSYPQRLIATKFKIRMKFIWDVNLDGKVDLETIYEKEITTPGYTPTIPTLSFTPTTSSNLTFGWAGANTSMITRMIIYSDDLCTKKIDSVNVTAETGTYISKIPVPDLSKELKFYVKQLYIQNSSVSGSIPKRYESASITVTNSGYQYPTNLTGSYIAGEQKINLTWTSSNTIGSAVRYHIKRDGVFITASEGQLGLSFTDFTTSTIKNWSSYTYTVIAVPSGCSKDKIFTGMSATYTVPTTPIFPTAKDFSTDFKLVAHPTVGSIKPYMTLSWDPSKWVSQNVVKLYHKGSNDAAFSLVGIMTPDSKTFNDNSSYIVDNSKHSYYLEVTVFDNSHIYTSQTESGSVEKTVAFKSFKASKNTIGDRIQLTWEIDRKDLCDRFEIYRSYIKDSTGESTTPEMIQQLSAQTVYNTFDDLTAVAGVVNTYQIIAYQTGLDKILRITKSPEDKGFRMPVGTVTGRITYGGGTAVGGVSLYVNSSKLDDNMLYKSIEFKGTKEQKGEVKLTKLQHGCASTGFTFQTWMLSTRPKLYTPIFEVNQEYSIGIQNDSVLLYIGSINYSTPALVLDLETSKIAANTYFHLSASLASNDSIKLYINGQLKKTGKLTQKSTCLFIDEVLDSSTGDVKTARTKSYIANTTSATQASISPYNGKIDDVRLWSMALADKVIAENYNHYLGGNETGLIGYWPLDEGVNKNAFDCSKTDNKYNEHHIDFTLAYTSTTVPSQSQLSIKGITDNDGNYIIRGIPFSGTGSTYSIQPILGTHKFEPTQLVRYISPSSLVHNSSDFTDKSSFPVKIKVKYSNTNYPVPGVMFYIDENPCSIENKLVTTASQKTEDNPGEFKTIDVGECVLDVPIGEHYIRAELAGHSFEKNGRSPAFGKTVFNENSVNVIEFADTSLVTVVGRVVGGAVEDSYPIGFKNSDKLKNHTSHANIGKAKIILEPSLLKSNMLNDGAKDTKQKLSASEATKFGSRATFKALSNKVEIITDSLTGEYMVKLPPIQWDVMSVNTSNDAQYKYENSLTKNIIQSFNTSTLISAIDTAKIIETNKVDTFKYNVKKSFTYTAPTVIEVRDAYTGSIAYGESEWHVTSPEKTEVVRSLYTIDNSTTPKTVDYTYGKTPANQMGRPIFAQGKTYALKISAFESYEHPEGLDLTTMKEYAKVPLKGDTITVTNEIGVLVKKIVPDANDTIATHVMKLDNNGQINYIFKAGFPNLANINSGLSMNISLLNGKGNPVVWNEMGDFRGIVLGCEPIAGTNFVTKGPVYPLVVLRDPPGSNSYAYMETGTTLSYSFVNKTVLNGNNSGSLTMKIGPEIETAAGLGFMVMADMKSISDTKIGLEGETSSFTGKTGTKTLTTKERIQTSASPDFVGSNADVYIGISTNTYYCQSRDLNIQSDGLEIKTISTGSISGDTEFRFSQNEIITAQIPKWKQILSEQLVTVLEANLTSATNEYQALANNNKKNYYLTTLSSTDPNFGLSKSTYTILRPTSNLNLPDTIETITNTITSWKNIISKNEEQKRKATNNTDYVKTNISFDAGVSVERAYNYSDNKGTTSGASDKTMAVLGTSTGFTLNGIGLQGDLETKIGGGSDNQNNSSTENTTTFGYVLSDPDADNRFAVNVYKNKFLDTSESNLPYLTDRYVDSSLSSYIFEIAGGQSSCPNEVADSSLYYKENNKNVQLANGTTPLDAPYINITSNTKTGIPNGKDATFSLELENKSIIKTPRAYVLSVDETSNPYGAVVSVDGTPLTTGRLYYVTPNQTLYKTLTFRQTRLDVLDYQNIKLKFTSVCDTITKTQNINVTYVPSCSDLEIALDRQIINTVNSAPLTVTFKNFNQEYKNFLGLQLEYKMEGETNWRSKVFAKDQTAIKALKDMNITNDMLIPNTVNGLISAFDYQLTFDEDGNYTVRAKTLCSNGTQTPINNITSEFSVIRDLDRPKAMGVPSPANGILTPETEVSITFNENIQTSKLTPDNFEVTGVLNGATLQHAEGLALDGSVNSQAFTESSISLQNGSFSIEGWVRTADDCSNYGNLFTIGTGSDKVSLYMKKDGMDLKINDVSVSSKNITAKSDWQYVSMAYDIISQTITVNLLTSSSSVQVITKKLSFPINPVGRLLVGTGFKGNIHQVVVWSGCRTTSDLTDINTAKTGTERNLIGYWPMDEASGTIAADKASSRNMTVNSSWFIEPNGKSTVYNGVDQSTVIKPTYNQFAINDNFSLEFWFKGISQANATMFSCGKGTTDLKTIEKLSVGFNNSRELCLNSKGISYVVPNVSVLDNVWHHFALSVLRGGNTNVYVDGLQKLQLPSSNIGGMSSDQISLGSRTYTDSTLVSGKYTYKTTQDQCFNGALDEVRIWKSSLTSENIKLDMHSRLNGTEAGLVAYYPFESNANGGVTSYSLKDFSVTNAEIAVSNALESVNTPGIKIPRAKEDVIHHYTASDNKIIFTIDASYAKTENCNLEFAVKNLYDLNGNMLKSPIKWTAFVNNNRLNWETENVSITKQVLEAASFKATIVNKSGKYENYVIDGLPSWLSVDKSSGTLNPLEKKELTFTVDQATNIGSYETRVTLTGNNGIKEMLPVSLKVTGPRPDWTVNPYGSESSMNVIGQIKIGGIYQEDKEDIIAAFMGMRCVGLASPQFDKIKNAYYLYMDIYGNAADNNQALTYSLWDAGTGRIYPGVDIDAGLGSFTAAAMIGTIESPKTFNATDKVEQQLSLKQGWNWLSTNVVSTSPSLLDQLKEGVGTVGEQLKSKNDGYMDYSSGGWYGTLQSLNQKSMYMLKTNEAKTVKMVGAMAKPEAFRITLNTEWNYIGYLPSFVAPLKVALNGFTPKPGDQIKGQVGFASYSGSGSTSGWYGSLQYLMPGLGYMYNSMNSNTFDFSYPSQYLSSSKVISENNETVNMKWPVDANKYQMSMTVTGIAAINGSEVANSDIQVGVFVGDECRGSVVLKYVDTYKRYMAFLMVWGNMDDVNKKITFRCYNPTNSQELIAVDQSLSFVPDNITGSPASPYRISFITSGNAEVDMNKLKVYPNPVTNMLHFDYDPSGIQQLEVLDNMGRILFTDTHVMKNTLNVGNLVSGAYTLRIKYNGKLTNHLFIRK